MKITPQAVQYGNPHREAGALPDVSEFPELLKGAGITPGLLNHRETESQWDDE